MILITGATGLVGSHLLYDLVSAGHNVRALKRQNSNLEQVRKIFSFYTNQIDSLWKRIEWIDGDMLDIFTLEKSLEGITHVYHTAAMVSFDVNDHSKMQSVNVVGTRNLVNICLSKKIKKLCFVSSIAALGVPEEGTKIVTEKTPWRHEDKRSGYSLSKFQSELEIWRGINEGLNAVIVNPSIILGPGQWDKGSSQLFSTVSKGLKYYTKGITGYIDVRDVSRAMIQLMESEISNERFILNSEDLTYRFIFKTIAQSLGVKGPTRYASPLMTEIAWRIASLKRFFQKGSNSFTKETARAAHNTKYYSNQKIKEALNFEFIPITRSINDTMQHYPLKH